MHRLWLFLLVLFACAPKLPKAPLVPSDLTLERNARDTLEIVARGDGPAAARPDVRLALGEAWAREAERRELEALGRHITAYDACFDTPGCVPAFLEPDLADSRMAWRRAGARFRQALELDPDGPFADDAAFGLAWSWRALGEPELADAVLCWLTARHPETGYRRDALLLRGEFDWSAYDHAPAPYDYASAWMHGIDTYGTLAADPDEPLRAFAAYRAGWLWYTVGEYGRSIDSFRGAAVASGLGRAPSGAAPVVPLQDEALEALVRVYADAGELDGAYGSDRLGDRATVVRMLILLAETYTEQGKWDQAIQSWRRLASDDLAHRVAYQARIVDLYGALAQPDAVVTESARLLAWASTEPQGPEADAAVERAVRESAFTLHRSARRGRPDLYSAALALYAEHRARWPDVRNSPAIAWGRAVALEESGAIAAAHDAYAALLASAPNGMYARDCAAALARVPAPTAP